MINLMPYLKEHFLSKEEYFKYFAHADSRVESWFKGELIYLFEKLKNKSVILDYKREESSKLNDKKLRIDFRIIFGGQNHYVELKTPCISKSSTNRDLKFYFRDNKVGLIKDFRKLSRSSAVNIWVLAFFYPNPGVLGWNRITLTVPESLSRWKPITRPDEYPDFLFISLWKG